MPKSLRASEALIYGETFLGAGVFAPPSNGKFRDMRLIKIALLTALALALVAVLVAAPRNAAVIRGQLAPDFSATALDGRAVSLAELRGRDPVVLNFFSESCPPCRVEVPHLRELAEKYGSRGLRVVSVSLDEDRTLSAVLPNEVGVKFPVISDPDGHLAELYGVQALPHTVVLDRRGTVHAVLVGADLEGLDAAVEQVTQ